MNRRVILATLALILGLLCPASAAPATVPAGWTTSGVKILDPNGNQFIISGINWYGLEYQTSPAGLNVQDISTILNAIKAKGFNSLRIPFASQVWETNPLPSGLSACSSCTGKHSRDILALIINYAGSIGLHVILDNHRSEMGGSAEGNGLWYASGYTEQSWISDWVHIEDWVHGISQSQGSADTVQVNLLASDGFPIVMGYDLRNEPHTASSYATGAQWGSGDGIDPATNPNPNPFAPACVAASTCLDWRLAAERAGDKIFGEAVAQSWSYPLIFVEGVQAYPIASGTHAAGPYDYVGWGEALQGVNGNANNAGAPIVFNAGGTSAALGPAVDNQVVYSAHDYGPSNFVNGWFNTHTCYVSGCGSSSLVDVWTSHWAFIAAGQINPLWPGHASFPWSNTGAAAYSVAPFWIGEFGTGNTAADLTGTGAGSQGEWFTGMVNFIQSSFSPTAANNSGVPVSYFNWSYWAFNPFDAYGLFASDYVTLANNAKDYTYLCALQKGPFALAAGVGAGQCGSTGALPAPPSCAFSLDSGSATITAAGGAGSLHLNATGPRCGWTAVVNPSGSWLSLTSTATGTATATISFNAAVSHASMPRSTTIVAGGQTFTVTQQATAEYLIGDALPSTGNAFGQFGDGSLNTVDLLATLRASTKIPGATPPVCSDLFDAMDSVPVDGASRGGDGDINLLDVLQTLRRVTGSDSSRPTRLPRLTCTAPPPGTVSKAEEASRIYLAFERTPAGLAVYLRSSRDVALTGVTLGLEATTLASDSASIVDRSQAGAIAAAWLGAIELTANRPLLLGTLPGVSRPPTVYGVSGVSAGDRLVRIGVRRDE